MLYLVSRLGSDIAVVQEGMTTNISMLIRSVIFVIASMVIVFIISWELTLVMIASIIPVMVFSVSYGNMMKKTQKLFRTRKPRYPIKLKKPFQMCEQLKRLLPKEKRLQGSRSVIKKSIIRAISKLFGMVSLTFSQTFSFSAQWLPYSELEQSYAAKINLQSVRLLPLCSTCFKFL